MVKVGYPVYDEFTGNATAPNPDIKCLNDDCTEATWSNPSWKSIVPGLNIRNPPIKDTVNVPWGGYVVVRIIADNPGKNVFLNAHHIVITCDVLSLCVKDISEIIY